MFLLHVGGASAVPPGIVSALHGAAVGSGDFELNLQPPHQTSQDIQESLDSLMQIENSKEVASNEDFAREKQAIINAAKASIRGIVSSALEPLVANGRL